MFKIWLVFNDERIGEFFYDLFEEIIWKNKNIIYKLKGIKCMFLV